MEGLSPQNIVVLALVLIGALLVFMLIGKILRLLLRLLVIALLVLAGVAGCVWAGYLPPETLALFNPFAVGEAGCK